MKTEGLEPEELKMRAHLEGKRCVYEADQFLKISEVREIVEDGISALARRLRQADDTIRKSTNTIREMEGKVRGCVS